MQAIGRDVRTFPSDDGAFRSAVLEAFADLAPTADLASSLQTLLRSIYPGVVVHDGEPLAELVVRPLYVYRYGSPTARR